MTPSSDFASLGVPSSLLEAIGSLGFDAMTKVQAHTLPSILERKDVLCQAETGSGKTLAFGIGMLAAVIPQLTAGAPVVRALAVCPTRELAEQIATELRRLARRTPNVKVLALCGGVPFRPQRESLKQGAHLVIGTPGRLEEHLRKGSLHLDALEVLVLDEADRMLSMGFAPQIDAIMGHVPAVRQTLLFSATIDDPIAELGRRYQSEPLRFSIEAAELAPVGANGAAEPRSAVEQRFHRVDVNARAQTLARWLSAERPASTLVFSNTRAECAEIATELRARGWVAAAIHGELAQRERAHVMRLFANESCSVLVATDVAARGWDIAGLAAVVHLGLPREPGVHLHRSGRTGRAGQPGLAVHFVADEDRIALAAIERYQGGPATFSELPLAGAAPPPLPSRATLLLAAGKNKKLRPGDILGALTAEGGVSGADVGAIHIEDSCAYVAVSAAVAERALEHLESVPIKGKTIRVRRVGLSLASDAD